MTGESLASAAALIVALTGFYAAWRSARKDEVRLLREEVARLQGRVDQLSQDNAATQQEVIYLRQENGWLRGVLREAGVRLPPMPDYLIRAVPDRVKGERPVKGWRWMGRED